MISQTSKLPDSTQTDSPGFINPFDDVVLIRYFEQLRLTHGTVKLVGIDSIDDRNSDLPLNALFVEPSVHSQISAENSSEPISALRAICDHQKLVLLGDPGSGKTTIVNWLCTALAQPLENKVTASLGRLVPLCLTLRDLPLGLDLTWKTLLDQFLNSPQGALFKENRQLLDALLTSGQAIVLLDGIDEVGSIEKRTALRNAVWQGWMKASSCRWLLTSRVVGYEEVQFHDFFSTLLKEDSKNFRSDLAHAVSNLGTQAEPQIEQALSWIEQAFVDTRNVNSDVYSPLFFALSDLKSPSSGFVTVLQVAPFSDVQVHQFIENWYRIRESDPIRASEFTSSLSRAIEDDPGTKELSRTPNLLTLIALIYRVRAKLPDGRAELYFQIASAYLKTIDEYRQLGDLPPYTFSEKMEWLSRVGWEMQLARTAKQSPNVASVADREILATEKDVISWLNDAMRSRFGSKTEEEAFRFLEYLQRRTGLFIARGNGLFAFLHLSFQEFFAAHYLGKRIVTPSWIRENLISLTDDTSSSLRAIKDYTGNTTWQEVLIFLFESLDREWLKEILDNVFPAPTAPPKDKYPLEIEFHHWCLAARLAGDPHLAISETARLQLMKNCWSWEVSASAAEHGRFNQLSLVSKNLLSRRDTRELSWEALRGIAENIKVEKLSLIGCADITDLSPLQSLSFLQSLNLTGCTALTDLSPLQSLSSLQSLDITGCTALIDLAPVQSLSSLHSLCLYHCTALTDLSPLQSLSSLQSLILFNCIALTDLSPLQSLSSLRNLFIFGCPALSDLSPLRSISSLRNLFIFDYPALSDLSPLQSLSSLQSLQLSDCPALSDLSPLQSLSSLQSLQLSGCTALSDLSPLQSLSSLLSLNLSGCSALSDLSPLQSLSSLQSLDLTGCTALTDLAPLQSLSYLQALNLTGCLNIPEEQLTNAISRAEVNKECALKATKVDA